MTILQLCLVVYLIAAALFATGIVLMRLFSPPTWFAEDTALDPVHQPRASTLPEPINVEVLFCLAFLVFAIAALGLLLCGFADGMARWMAEQVVAAHPH
jgi:hypothetical protein